MPGPRMEPDPTALARVLAGLSYPARTWHVLAQADYYGADAHTRTELHRLPVGMYPSLRAVISALHPTTAPRPGPPLPETAHPGGSHRAEPPGCCPARRVPPRRLPQPCSAVPTAGRNRPVTTVQRPGGLAETTTPSQIAAAECWWITESWPSPGGRVTVLRVTGEIDLLTYSTLQTALDVALFGAVDHPTRHLVIDLSEVTFCGARGLALLADTAITAAMTATSYALSGCPAPLERHWRLLCPDPAVPRHASTAQALAALGAHPAQRTRTEPGLPGLAGTG